MGWLLDDLDDADLRLTAAEEGHLHKMLAQVNVDPHGKLTAPSVYTAGALLKDEVDAGRLGELEFRRMMRWLLERL